MNDKDKKEIAEPIAELVSGFLAERPLKKHELMKLLSYRLRMMTDQGRGNQQAFAKTVEQYMQLKFRTPPKREGCGGRMLSKVRPVHVPVEEQNALQDLVKKIESEKGK